MTPVLDLLVGSVLELGAHDGSWHTGAILTRAGSNPVAVIELDALAANTLRVNWPTVRVLVADYHSALAGVGQYDSITFFGVLGHSHAPLDLIESAVIYVKPKRIFIEAEPGGLVRCVREGVNQPGQRQSRRLTCGLSLQLGMLIYRDALANLGYESIFTYTETQGHRAGFEYSVFERV